MVGAAEALCEADAIGALGPTEGAPSVAIDAFGPLALGGAPPHPAKSTIAVRAVHRDLIPSP